MSVKHNLEQWIAQLDYDDTCDITDRQVSDLIRNYAALEDRCAALAAENAGLKSIQAWAVADVFKSGAKRFESTKTAGFDTDDCLHDAVLVMLSELKAPATDAFLAEVRAQGVDVARNVMIDFVDGEVGPNENVPGLIRSAEICVSIAANLRKGAI